VAFRLGTGKSLTFFFTVYLPNHVHVPNTSLFIFCRCADNRIERGPQAPDFACCCLILDTTPSPLSYRSTFLASFSHSISSLCAAGILCNIQLAYANSRDPIRRQQKKVRVFSNNNTVYFSKSIGHGTPKTPPPPPPPFSESKPWTMTNSGRPNIKISSNFHSSFCFRYFCYVVFCIRLDTGSYCVL
jgi:hypothetical protein